MGSTKHWRAAARHGLHRAVLWGERVPRGLRSLCGLPLVIGGLLGFLPIVGFWMLPLGLGLIALDVPALRRRLERWLADPPEPGDRKAANGHHPGGHRSRDGETDRVA